MFSLKNKVAVVTGGSGDLGYAISKAYLEAGANVILVGRNISSLKEAVHKLQSSDRSMYFVTDVSDGNQVNIMIEKVIEKYGRIDILVTAAGIQYRSPVVSFDHKKWEEVVKVNLNGTFYCAQAVAKQMVLQRSGRIIMITSLTAEIGIPNISAYAASRGGIRQLSKTLAVELAPMSITVNCIGPGRFQSSMTEDIFKDEIKRKKFLDVIPMGRPGSPEDLVGVSVFLASDASAYITGQSIYVDGGWLAGSGNVIG